MVPEDPRKEAAKITDLNAATEFCKNQVKKFDYY